MTTKVAVAHYSEGVGHATRMAAVARALADRGASVVLAGGGPGRRFVERLGYEEFVPAPVDFVGQYQEGSLRSVVAREIPAAARRVRDYVGWLRRESPDVLVTDDMFAAMAAPLVRTPLYVVTHNAPSLYRDFFERFGADVLTRFQCRAARTFLYPAIWPTGPGDPSCVSRVPPIALDVGTEVRDADVVVVPSAYSTDLSDVADRLDDRGHDVLRVGGPHWTPVDSLLPTLREADRVVCAGYSTVMEAAVAGTPCVVYPFTSEQRGVARRLEDGAVDGFAVARTVDGAVRAAERPLPDPLFENGAMSVAGAVLTGH